MVLVAQRGFERVVIGVGDSTVRGVLAVIFLAAETRS